MLQCFFPLHTSVTNRLMKSFAVCFICRDILCVLTSYKSCQGKQIKPYGKQLHLTVTPVFLTCLGQVFHRAKLTKMLTGQVWQSNNRLFAVQPFCSELGWCTLLETSNLKSCRGGRMYVSKLLVPNRCYLGWASVSSALSYSSPRICCKAQ